MKTPKSMHAMPKGRQRSNDFHEGKIKRMLGKSQDEAAKVQKTGKAPDPVTTMGEDKELFAKKSVSGETRALSSIPRVTRGP